MQTPEEPPAAPSPSAPAPLSPSTRIQGTGEMADCIRRHPWHTTHLGPIEQWSENLVTSVNLMLLSPFSSALYWGEAFTLLYNDAYRHFLSSKHPGALGSSGPAVWAEAWPIIGPPIEQAFHHSAVSSDRGVLIPILVDNTLEDRWWTYGFYPVFQDGRVVGVANPGHEDTSLVLARQAEAETLRLSAELGQVLSSTTDAIATIDHDWNLTYLNPRGRQLYDPDGAVLGKNIWQSFPAAVYDGSPLVEKYHRAMNDGIPDAFETFYPEPLNFWIRVEVYPTPTGIVTFSRDISDQKRAEATLIKTEKLAAVGRLAASIAHEINNPLEAITNLLYLARGSANLDEARGFLDTADSELQRVSSITNQTLRFYRQSTRPVPILAADLLGGLLSIFHGRLLNSHIHVERRDLTHLPVLCFDGEIRQVLSNLIGNAIDAMRSTGGTLHLRSREATDHPSGRRGLRITIADTGDGMAPTTLAHLFEAFYTTKGINGTGLGLWITKEIVDRHEGALAVRSRQQPGLHGTVFTLFLPLKSVV